MKAAAVWTLALLIPLTTVSGQEPGSPTRPEAGLFEEILRLYQAAKEAGEQVPRDVYDWLEQDVQSFGDWEYRVLDLGPLDAAAMEARLNELGTDRWECIWVQSAGRKTRLILKRPTTSYLRQIPLSRLMRLLPQGDAE